MTCLRWCWVMLAALAAVAASPGHAQSRSRSAPCGCYCNIWLPAPCSDAACKAACGYREPGSGAISSPQPGSGAFTPQPDFEAERRAQDESRRKQEEDARLDADRRKAEQDRKFAEERDAAAKSLKGAEPPSGAGNALGLKGVTPSSGALRDLPRVEPVPSPSALLRREELDRLIARDAEAIRRLGFARRAEDFAEWERLAAQAKAEFEGEIIDAIAGFAVDKARGRLLDSFKGFDAAKAARMAAWLRARSIKPEPAALIAAIERVGRAANKSRVADDAEFIVKQIEDYRSARAAAGNSTESAKFVSGLLEGTIADPRVAFLITELKLTTAAVYNNATRRVARTEVERLTKLTEQQLKDLERLRKLMEAHVRERNALIVAQEGTK